MTTSCGWTGQEYKVGNRHYRSCWTSWAFVARGLVHAWCTNFVYASLLRNEPFTSRDTGRLRWLKQPGIHLKSVGILWNPEKPISQTFQNHLILAWEVIRSYQVHPSSSQPYLGLKGFGFGTFAGGLVGLVGFGTPPEPPEPPEGAEAAGAAGAGGASRGALGAPGGALGAPGALKNWMEMDGVPWSDSGWYLIWAHWALGPRGTSFKCLVAGKLQLRLFNRPMLNAPCESAKTNKCNIPYYRNMLQLTSNFKPSRCCLKKSGHAHHVQKKNTSTWHVEAKRTALLPFLKLALAKE